MRYSDDTMGDDERQIADEDAAARGFGHMLGSDASTLTDVFNVIHPIGEGVLKSLGAGALAAPIKEIQQAGLESMMSPEEKQAAQVKKQLAAAAAVKAEVQAKQEAARQAGLSTLAKVGIVGGLALAIALAVKLLTGGRKS